MIPRRQFISLLGGAAAAWPLAAWGQGEVRRIGVLAGGGGPDDPDAQARIGAFLHALAQLGWTDGRNVRIDARWPCRNAGAAVPPGDVSGLPYGRGCGLGDRPLHLPHDDVDEALGGSAKVQVHIVALNFQISRTRP